MILYVRRRCVVRSTSLNTCCVVKLRCRVLMTPYDQLQIYRQIKHYHTSYINELKTYRKSAMTNNNRDAPVSWTGLGTKAAYTDFVCSFIDRGPRTWLERARELECVCMCAKLQVCI